MTRNTRAARIRASSQALFGTRSLYFAVARLEKPGWRGHPCLLADAWQGKCRIPCEWRMLRLSGSQSAHHTRKSTHTVCSASFCLPLKPYLVPGHQELLVAQLRRPYAVFIQLGPRALTGHLPVLGVWTTFPGTVKSSQWFLVSIIPGALASQVSILGLCCCYFKD